MASIPQKDIPTEALVVEEAGGPFVMREVLLDGIQPEELLVEIKYAGLCHTDLVVQGGYMPMVGFPAVLGHEGAGIVRRVGDGLKDSGISEGDSVILSYCSCMSCSPCLEGRKGACETIAPVNFGGTRSQDSAPAVRTADGGKAHGLFFGQSSFSKLAVVDSRAVVKYDGDVKDLEALAPLGCGYMTGAATVMNVIRPKPKSTMAVLGLGAVGLSAIMAAKHEGVQEIIAIDIIESRLKLASSFGATKVIDSKNFESIEAGIRSLFPGGVNSVIDATGSTVVMESGMRALAHGGIFAIVGMPRPDEVVKIQPLNMLTHCNTVIGVTGGYCDPQEFIPRLIEMFKSGEFPVDKLHKTYPASEMQKAIDDMKTGEVVKPVLAW